MFHFIIFFLTFWLQGIKENSPSRQIKTSIAWTAGWSHDDKYIAIGNDNGELSIYETRNWKKIKSWHVKACTITRIEWNPKYRVLAVAGIDRNEKDSLVQLFDMSAGNVIKHIPSNQQGRCVTWSPDGELLALAGSTNTIYIHDRKGNHIKTLSYRHPRTLMDIDWHPTRNILLLVEEDIYMVDVDKDSLLATYDDGSKGKGILSCQWHPSGNFFVTGDYGHENEGGEPSYIKFWKPDGSMVRRIKESKYEFRNLRWRRDGKFLAASADVLLLLDEKGNLINKTAFSNDNLWGVGWNSMGTQILSSDQVGNVRVSDLTGKVLKSFVQ